MLSYEKEKEEIIAAMDFLPDDPALRETFFVEFLKLLLFN